jgi:PPOX class probable F420-dependent enzyme
MGLSDEKYVSFTTYKRDGTAVATPTWVVALDDGRVGFYTSSVTGKAKRLRHTSTVLVQPSDSRGRAKAGTTPLPGTAELVTGAVHDEVTAKVKAKYGFMTKVAKALGRLRHPIEPRPYADVAVVVTLEPSS